MNSLLTFSVVLNVSFSVLTLASSNFLNFWLTLELASLSLIPCFFFNTFFSNTYMGLINYILVLSISSSLIFIGLLYKDLNILFYLGFFMKFGGFPFMFWYLNIFLNGSWLLIFLLSAVSKIPVLIISQFNPPHQIIFYLVALTLTYCSFFFWFGMVNLKSLWCNMVISSASVLYFVVCFFGVFEATLLLSYYIFFVTVACFLFNRGINDTFGGLILFIFILSSFPVSIGFGYKVISIYIFNFSGMVLFWIFYGVSEQYYIINFFLNTLTHNTYKF